MDQHQYSESNDVQLVTKGPFQVFVQYDTVINVSTFKIILTYDDEYKVMTIVHMVLLDKPDKAKNSYLSTDEILYKISQQTQCMQFPSSEV